MIRRVDMSSGVWQLGTASERDLVLAVTHSLSPDCLPDVNTQQLPTANLLNGEDARERFFWFLITTSLFGQ